MLKIPSPYLANCPERDTYIFSKMVSAYGNLDGARILDMGCGTAPLAKLCFMYGKDVRYMGYDTHPGVVDSIMERHYPSGFSISRGFPVGLEHKFDIAISIGIPSLASGGDKIAEDHKKISPKLVVLETGWVKDGNDPKEMFDIIRDDYMSRGEYRLQRSCSYRIRQKDFPVPSRVLLILQREDA